MAREQNFLLGEGERLASQVRIGRRSGNKNPPYDFARARKRVARKLENTLKVLRALPSDACPRGEAVALVTLHPRYLSKSEFPSDLLANVGLRTVGSRPKRVTPEAWGIEEHGDTALTSELFVAGSRASFEGWNSSLEGLEDDEPGASRLAQLEDIAPLEAESKLHALPDDINEVGMLEIVLHNSGTEEIVRSFVQYAQAHGGEPVVERRRDVKGLTFMPVRASAKNARRLAKFAFVRVARGMPTMRPFRPALMRAAKDFAVSLPTQASSDATTRAVIFDGGITKSARKSLEKWVRVIEPPGIGKAIPDYEAHGLGVTTAFLFGPLTPKGSVRIPLCDVDHVRVLDDNVGADLQYYDVLDRITHHLDKNPGAYKFVNLSLGPAMAIDDEEVTLWTASLDRRFAHDQVLATVAAGNDGALDATHGLNRVQPPADGVNVLSVGACDSTGLRWGRAEYSCVGPGRCPGMVKPDGVIFGGVESGERFGVLTPQARGSYTQGTSFAAPYALRSAAAVRAQLESRLSPLAIRALLVHRAEQLDGTDWREIGWGRFDDNSLRLITCEDHEALVVYQGLLPVSEHLRAPVPLPKKPMVGMVTLTATLVIAPEVDPEYPDAYTRAGLEVAFRPNSAKYAKTKKGPAPAHPATESFFSESLVYGSAKNVLREDGHKWEPCLRSRRAFRATSLSGSLFDIYYHHRDGAGKATSPQPIPYALIVGVSAPRVPDLYNQIVRAHSHVLQQLRPLALKLRT